MTLASRDPSMCGSRYTMVDDPGTLTNCSFERSRPAVAGNLALSPKERNFETLEQLQ